MGTRRPPARPRRIGPKESRTRASRLIDANRKLFRRLADSAKVKRTIRRAVKDYRKTLRKLASGPRRGKKT